MSREDFNQLAASWDETVYHDPEKISRIISELPLRKHTRILDVGSGTGVLIPFLREHYRQGVEITELDFSEKMVEKAREKFGRLPGVRYLIGDIYNYPFNDEVFDIIICYSVFPHFPDQRGVLKRLRALLKGNGLLLIFHSQSREEINRVHREREEFRSDRLPPAVKVVDQALELGYRVEKVVDNSRFYLIKLRNSGADRRSGISDKPGRSEASK